MRKMRKIFSKPKYMVFGCRCGRMDIRDYDGDLKRFGYFSSCKICDPLETLPMDMIKI